MDTDQRRRVAVIGGGASGLMAAIASAGQGAAVTLLEKNNQTGKKLLVTGNGRCNFSNRDQNLSHYRTDTPALAADILKACPMEDTVRFFERLGMGIRDRDGYLYPASAQASSVAELLRLEAVRQKVKIKCSTPVLGIERGPDGFLIKTDGWSYEADAVVLCCGSQASPDTGSTGDGYAFAKRMGHTVSKPLPALTGLCAADKDCKGLAGVRFDARVTLFSGEEILAEEEGEVQFTSYGLSGIPVFQISRFAARALQRGESCQVGLDLMKEQSREQIAESLKRRRDLAGERRGTDILLGMFPEKLSAALLSRAGISLKKSDAGFTDEDYLRLAGQIRDMRFRITGCLGFEKAQVCTGGVPLTELKGTSMESALVPGLYLAGELLDVDGACGGYNLQWAWSTGYLAGVHAACPKDRKKRM